MSGVRSLDKLVTMDSVRLAVLASTATVGPPGHDSASEALWKEAENDWLRLWTGLFATLLAEDDGTVLEVKTLKAMVDPNPIKPVAVVSHMPTVERSVRRLLGCIRLERMMEERTLADYRSEVENRFRQVHEEAETWLPLAIAAVKGIDACEVGLSSFVGGGNSGAQGTVSWAETMIANMSRIKSGLLASIDTLKLFESQFGEPAKEFAFIDSLRPTWIKVNQDFGTWVRRLKPALLLLAAGSLVAIAMYMIIGMFVPTPLILVMLFGFVAIASIARYFKTRERIEKEIEGVSKRFSDLDPPAGGFWTGEQTQLKVMVDSEKGRVDQSDDGGGSSAQGQRKQGRNTKGRLDDLDFIYKTLLVLVLLLLIYSFVSVASIRGAGLAPVFTAFSGSDAHGSTCSMARGVVQWAGPGRVILHHKVGSERVLSFLDPSGMTGLSNSGRWRSCAEPAEATSTGVDTSDGIASTETDQGAGEHADRDADADADSDEGSVVGVGSGGAFASEASKLIIVPFIGKVESGCRGEFTGDGAIPDSTGMRAIRLISDALSRCGSRDSISSTSPAIDVQGFSSSKEFNCGSIQADGDPNLRLAEHRRTVVLQALGARFGESEGKWYSSEFVIKNPTRKRWADSAEMKNAMLFQHHDDPMARYVAIEIVRPGSCVASSS
jgi:hypothetical protein